MAAPAAVTYAGKPASFYAATGNKPVEGAWYGGQRYMGGQLLAPGQDQAGHNVSAEVIAQTNPNNVAYVQKQQAAYVAPAGQSPADQITGAPVGLSGGISGDGGVFGAPKPIDLQSIYDNALKASGVTDLQKKAVDLQTQLTEQTNNINENPLLAEGSRTGKIKTLSDYAGSKIDNANNQVAQAKADAQIKVNIASGQFTQNQQIYQNNLQTFNSLLSSGALASASGQDIANLSSSIGVPTGIIASAIAYQNEKNVETSVIQSTDKSGNVTASIINTKTGVLIKQTSLGKVAAGSGGSGATAPKLYEGLSAMSGKLASQANSYGNVSPGTWNTALAAWIGAGFNRADFVANFGQYADTNRDDFVAAYGFANPATK